MNELTPLMSAERWLRVQALFSAALDCDIAKRSELLDLQCADDAELRRDVESLLDSHESPGLVDELAEKITAPAVLRARLATLDWQGRRVAQYTVLEALGAGAMGRIYKARDERLGRYVALKFLPAHLGAEPNARRRLLLEARAAAALDHSNICTIHEIGATEDGQQFIAMTLYDGETLQARLTRGPLDLVDVVAIGLQIANGLAKAHEHGVIHRDVKPSNIMLLADGTVKILDFGIARIEDVPAAAQDGMALGTVAYMSPEQARGDAVDTRTDVWSLGVVLYEMFAGVRPFRGDSTQELRHQVLTTDPRGIGMVCTGLPAAVNALLSKALAKNAGERYASMAQMAADLAALVPANRWPASVTRRTDTLPVAEAVDDATLSTSGERRRAAVLVSMLSDYVSLIEQLTPPKLEELAAGLRDLAADVAQRHGGLVNRVSGEEIVCVFGIPVAHEDDDLRAVRAAIELHARVQELGGQNAGDLRAALHLQSGVHSGRLVARRLAESPRRYDVKGPAAQVAARLAALARRDAILVSPECQRLIAPFMETTPYESFVLHADTASTIVHRVVGESGLQTRLEAAEREGLTPYTGRRVELASLESLFAQAREGRGQIVFVVGEAGVGKSRLLHEFRTRVIDTGTPVLPARCRSYGGVSPYLPFIEILKAGLGLQEEARPFNMEEVAARIRAIDPALDRFVPLYLHILAIPAEAYPLPRHFRGDHLQAAVPEALASILTRLFADGPRVFLLEDWHWSDAGSREALRRLSEIVASHALLIVVTTRPDERSLVEVSGSESRLDLPPLDFENSLVIMTRVMHVQHVSNELARRLFERTGGNPFFLEEMCRALVEQGSVAALDGEGVAAVGNATLQLPDTVQAVIRTRLDGLDRQALELLRVASVVGRDFNLELLVEVMGAEADPMQAIERLVTAGLIQGAVSEGGYRFKHALTQEVTYDSLLEHQRRGLHELVGYAMERTHARLIDEQAELLAHHFSRAEIWAIAVRYGRHAADRASALSQFADALLTLDRVHEWVVRLREDDERSDLLADVLLQQERLCETLGQRGRQEQIVDGLISQLAPRGASERLAQAYLRKGDLATLLRRFDAADRSLSTALRICRERNDVVLEHTALRSMGLLRWHEGRHAEALVITESALVIDRERGNGLALAVDLANRGVILKSMGDYPRALESLEEALATPSMAQDPPTQVYALSNIANVHRSLGNVASALEYLERANALAHSHLLPIQRSFHLMAIAHVLLQQGQIVESLKTYEEAVGLSRRARHADGLVQALRARGEVLCGLGRDAEALPCLEEAAVLFGQLEDRAGQVEMRTRCATLLEKGDPAAGEAAWGEVRALRARLGDRRGELEALEGIARTARRRCATPAEAIPRVEAALTLACTLGERSRESALRNTLGILEWECGHYPQALRHYEQTLALVRELGNRAHEGLALNSIAVTLARLNRHEEARTVLEESIQLNRETGEQLLEAHALAALGDVWCAVPRFDAARECYERSLGLRRLLGDRTGEEHLLQRLAKLPSETNAARA